MERRELLKTFHRLLSTPDGELLMAELESAWFIPSALNENPQIMGYNLGLSEAYKQLKAWQAGEGLHE